MFSAIDTINQYGLIRQNIGCAVSGGSDSMSLLHLMSVLRKKHGFNLICINMEHGIRGDSSREDSAFVKDYCQKNNIEFVGKSVDAPKYAEKSKMTLEQAARTLRYQFFYQLLAQKKCDIIFVAHNKNDNVESVLLHLFRGSGAKGVCGMDVDNKIGIARPLLKTDKAEIWDYIRQNNIPYVEDQTNSDTNYSRNYLRAEVLPKIRDKFEGAEDNILRFSQIIKSENDYLDELSLASIKKVDCGCKISLPLDEVLLRRAVMLACKMLGADSDIFEVHVQMVVKLASGRNGNFVTLSNCITAHKDYDGIFLERADIDNNFDKLNHDIKSSDNLDVNKTADINDEIKSELKSIKCLNIHSASRLTEILDDETVPFKLGETIFGDYVINLAISDKYMFGGDALYADGDKFFPSAVIRYRKSGDTFKRFGGKTKLLSDFLTDLKVPRRERGGLPIIANGENVLAVLPYDIADEVKIDKNTKTIYKITFYRRTK